MKNAPSVTKIMRQMYQRMEQLPTRTKNNRLQDGWLSAILLPIANNNNVFDGL